MIRMSMPMRDTNRYLKAFCIATSVAALLALPSMGHAEGQAAAKKRPASEQRQAQTKSSRKKGATEKKSAQSKKKGESKKTAETKTSRKKKGQTAEKETTRSGRKGAKTAEATSTRKGTKKQKQETRAAQSRMTQKSTRSADRGSDTRNDSRTTPSDVRRRPALTTQNRKGNTPVVATSYRESEPADLAQMTYDGAGPAPLVTGKQAPTPRAPLDSADLQSLAPVRLHPEVVVPLRGYPLAEPPTRTDKPVLAEASLGMYTTGAFRVGYSGVTWPYDYYARVEGGITQGFIDNAGKTNLSAELGGGYIIDDGYGIFSGGHMGADFSYGMQKYRRYAVPSAPERNRSGWQVAASGGNTVGGVTFDARGRYRSLAVTDSMTADESSLEGSLQLGALWQGFKIGGDAELRLTSLTGTSIATGNLGAYASYSNSFFTLRAGASLGVGENSDGSSVTKIAPAAELRIYPVSGLTLSAGVTGGIGPTSLQSLLQTNPYVVVDPLVRHEVERIGYNATLRLESSRVFGLRARAARNSYDNYAYFGAPVNGAFAPLYGAATVTKIDGDCYLKLGATRTLTASAIYMETQLDSTGGQVPYVPKWQIAASVSERLRGLPLTVTITGRAIGARQFPEGTEEMVTLLDVEGTYAIAGLFDVFVTGQNLLDRRYQIWDGYRERGIFGAVGIRTKF